MAVGTTAHMSTTEVANQCKSLEVSPSCHSPSSPIYAGGSKATGHGVKAHTGALNSAGKTTRPKPHGTKTTIGKKEMMHQKSRGR